MGSSYLNISDGYWEDFSVDKTDIEFINNYLFEKEIPLTVKELSPLLIKDRIQKENQKFLSKHLSKGKKYFPADSHKVDQRLVFPELNWKEGKVTYIRSGLNPAYKDFNVITVEFEGGEENYFASSFPDHTLNNRILDNDNKTDQIFEEAVSEHGSKIEAKLAIALKKDTNLVRIAGRWFPRALLIDINQGYLNLAEAIMDEAGGKPLSTSTILEHIEIPGNINSNLLEFSLNLALQEDTRFDEIGPAGEVLWCLKHHEPEAVRNVPEQLKYSAVEFDKSVFSDQMYSLEIELDDELSVFSSTQIDTNEIEVCLTYPHWRAGTLPASNKINPFIPFAYESERIQFPIINGKTNEEIQAWVVRKHKYVFGLKEFYEKNGLIPGSLISIYKGKKPGVVMIEAKVKRPTKEWVRTVLAGRDGGIVFAMLKQNITAEYNERMVVAVPDGSGLDIAREQYSKTKKSLEDSIILIMRDLTKLNLQGHIHAQELYSALNILHRCPPGPIFYILATRTQFTHVGDLHFRLESSD